MIQYDADSPQRSRVSGSVWIRFKRPGSFMSMSSVCLVVLFNHKFERNLVMLDELYRGRFSSVVYVMPFYTGNRPDVIPVYASSYVFQSYLTQARPRIEATGRDVFVVVADDMLLNPSLNEDNILTELKLEEGQAYIQELKPLSEAPPVWRWRIPSFQSFKRQRYVEFHDEIPTVEQAIDLLARHGVRYRALSRRELVPNLIWDLRQDRISVFFDNLVFWLIHLGGRTRQYPFLWAFSDFLVLPRKGFDRFCHLSGAFAAAGTFVETTIPTVVALTYDRIRVERDTRWKSENLILAEDVQQRMEKADFNLKRLLAAMPQDMLYWHPIKFSKLKNGDSSSINPLAAGAAVTLST
jgi:hypothetical protein